MSEYDMPSQTYFCQCAGCAKGQGSAFEAAPENWFRAKGISTPKNCPDCREWINTAGDSYVYCQYCTGRINLYRKYIIGYHKYKGKWQDPTECDMCKRAGADRVPRSVTKRASRQEYDKRRNLAMQAGVPPQYWNEAVISEQPDGSINIYFGGMWYPDGPGHAHYVMDKYGNVTYKRDPQKAHGAQNFADGQLKGWPDGGYVDGQPARVKQDGSRIDALWGGSRDNQKGDDHGHIASDDGVNANYVREPGGWVVLNDDKPDPYEQHQDRRRH